MFKQNQVVKSQHEKPAQAKNRPVVVTEQARGQVTIARLFEGLSQAAGNTSPQAQAACLGDPRFLTAQRQAIGAQIGRVGGNQYLQTVIAQMKQPGRRESDLGQMNSDANAQAFGQGSNLYFGADKSPAKEGVTAHALPPGVQLIRRNSDSRQRLQTVQMTPTASKESTLPAPRNEVELIGSRLKSRQIDLQQFLDRAKSDVAGVQHYFEWVNGVYKRCYGHYKLVLTQANAQAETTQAWVDFVVGVATGVAVGALFEVTLAAQAAKMGVELLSEAAAEMVEGGAGRFIKIEVPKATVLEDLAPELKEIQSLKNLDRLNKIVLETAIPGTYVYTDPIVQAERLTAELRVAEAGGQRRMSDEEIREQYLKLVSFDVKSLQLEATLKDTEAKFARLREYSKKPAPSDERCEQDIWIPWIAKQDVDTFWTPILLNSIIQHHLVDIGLAGWNSKGGRLNAQVSAQRPSSPRAASAQLKEAASNAASTLPEYWKQVFLLG